MQIRNIGSVAVIISVKSIILTSGRKKGSNKLKSTVTYYFQQASGSISNWTFYFRISYDPREKKLVKYERPKCTTNLFLLDIKIIYIVYLEMLPLYNDLVLMKV